MTPKEISRGADRIFGTAIPSNCAIRNQQDQEDYGIDYELELTDENDHATGFIFKVQLKGVEKLDLAEKASSLSSSGIKVARIGYYLAQVRIPAVFVVVDLASGKTFWIKLQDNPDLRKDYTAALAAGQDEMTVHLPVKNLLPQTFADLLNSVRETSCSFLVQDIKRTPSPELLAAAVHERDFEATAAAIQRHHEMFRLEQIETLLRSEQLNAAFQKAKVLFDSASESVQMRVAAALYLLRIHPVLLIRKGEPNRDRAISDFRIITTQGLLRITRERNADRRFRLYAVFLCRAARLNALAWRDFTFHLSKRAQDVNGDDFTKAWTNAIRMQTATAILREFKLIQRHLLWMSRRNCLEFFADAWCYLVGDIAAFLTRLRSEHLDESANAIIEWLDAVGEFAVDISKQLRDWKSVVFYAKQSIQLATGAGGEAALDARFKAARAIVQTIPDSTIREETLADLSEYREAFRHVTPSLQDMAELYRRMAAGMGIDLTNEEDEIAAIVNIGIRDLDPTRVVKNCQHLFVELTGGMGVPAQMLGLNTARMKLLQCTKFGYGIEALSLDDAYETLRETYCSKCKDCQPQPNGWQWSVEWQNQQHELHSRSSSDGCAHEPEIS